MNAPDGAAGWLTNGAVAAAARATATDTEWDRLVGAAESETTAMRNRLALDCIALRPRVLIGAGDVDPSTTWLGLPLRMPVLLASLGDARRITPDGLGATTAAASQFGTIPFVDPASGAAPDRLTGPAVLEIAAHDPDDLVDAQVDAARALGWAALCVGLVPYAFGRREREPIGERPAARTRDVWRILERLVDRAGVPVVAKGVTNRDDARRAIECGCRTVYVSNFGGRALDHGQATIDVLGDVVAAVDRRAEVIVDGGFARATDVLKALALGAQAVAIGRLHGLGLAAGGVAGLVRVLENLEDELRISMSLLGVTRVAEVSGRHVVANVAPVQPPHETSAFFRTAPVRRFP